MLTHYKSLYSKRFTIKLSITNCINNKTSSTPSWSFFVNLKLKNLKLLTLWYSSSSFSTSCQPTSRRYNRHRTTKKWSPEELGPCWTVPAIWSEQPNNSPWAPEIHQTPLPTASTANDPTTSPKVSNDSYRPSGRTPWDMGNAWKPLNHWRGVWNNWIMPHWPQLVSWCSLSQLTVTITRL